MTQRLFLDLYGTGEVPVGGRIRVPEGERALVLRDGLPEQFLEPGLHPVLLHAGSVEVRMLQGPTEVSGPPGAQALALPYQESYLLRDGFLMGVLKAGAEAPVRAWENWTTPARVADRYREGLRSCRSERLRACLPGSGACCGERLVPAA